MRFLVFSLYIYIFVNFVHFVHLGGEEETKGASNGRIPQGVVAQSRLIIATTTVEFPH